MRIQHALVGTLIAMAAAARAELPSVSAPATNTTPLRPAASGDVRQLLVTARDRISEEKWEEAAGLLQQAIRQDSGNEEALFGLSTVYTQWERYGEAVGLLEGLLKRTPESAVVKNNLAWIYAKAKDPALRNPEKAVKLARDAVLAVPSDYNIWNTLAEAYYACGKHQRALRVAQQALHMSSLAGVTNTLPLRELVERCKVAGAAKTE